MDNNLQNILSESNKDIDNQALLAYLNNHLPDNESHEIEKKMIEDDFMNDAVEGLQKMDPKKNIDHYINQLNADLHKHLSKRIKRNSKRIFYNQTWIYITIIILLSLIVLSYIVIKSLLH
jgi:CHASE3 domain sensor protein